MSKKTKAVKLPKRIGKVKLPKELRKGAGRLAEALASPAGQELIAGGLAIAAAAIKAQATRQRQSASASPAASAPPVPPRAANAPDPHEIGAELGRIAEAALQGLFGKRRG